KGGIPGLNRRRGGEPLAVRAHVRSRLKFPRRRADGARMQASPRRMPAAPNPFWHDRPVLVTGATGLLGSWLCEALVGRGGHVVALVRDLVPESLFHTGAAGGRCTNVFGDLRDG